MLRALGVTHSWKGTRRLQQFQAWGLCVSGASQGYFRTKARSVTPATWLCIPIPPMGGATKGFFLIFERGGKGKKADRYKIYSRVRDQLLPISFIYDSLNEQMPKTKS